MYASTPGVGHTENKKTVKQNTKPFVFNSGGAWFAFTSRLNGPFFLGIFREGGSSEITIKMTHNLTVKFFLCLINLFTVYCSMRVTVAITSLEKSLTNKVQENLQSKECYQEDKINSEKLKMGTKLVGDMSYFGDCPRKPRMNGHLSQDDYMETFYHLLQLLQVLCHCFNTVCDYFLLGLSSFIILHVSYNTEYL